MRGIRLAEPPRPADAAALIPFAYRAIHDTDKAGLIHVFVIPRDAKRFIARIDVDAHLDLQIMMTVWHAPLSL